MARVVAEEVRGNLLYMDEMLKRASIPQEAVLAFEGVRCRVYQWPQKMYDGSFATFEKIVRFPASTVIAIVDGKILIQEQEQPHRGPFLCLAGGTADHWDEPLEEVAKRELKEETGLESDDWQLLADISRRDYNVFEHHIYLARKCHEVSEPKLDNGEKITTMFVTVDEFRMIKEDPRWRHVDITAYLNKADNFDKLVALISS